MLLRWIIHVKRLVMPGVHDDTIPAVASRYSCRGLYPFASVPVSAVSINHDQYILMLRITCVLHTGPINSNRGYLLDWDVLRTNSHYFRHLYFRQSSDPL